MGELACLIDGNKTSNCAGGASANKSIGLDLGSPQSIGTVRIYFLPQGTPANLGPLEWFTGYRTFIVYSSSDNSTWTLHQTIENPADVHVSSTLGYVDLVLSSAINARYVKVRSATGWYHYNDSENPGASQVLLTEIEAYDPSQVVDVPVAGIVVSSFPVSCLPIFAPAASIQVSVPSIKSASSRYGPSGPAGAALTSFAPTATIFPMLQNAGVSISSIAPNYVWALNVRLRPAAQTIFTCTLTGDGESPALPDLTIPMSSFQGRIRDGDPSYLACVIPNALAYASAIAARQNGDIVIHKGYRLLDGTESMEEIARVDFESVRIDQGSRSASATITGHRTITSTAPKDVTVQGVSYYCLQADGKRRIRALFDLFLRIGDTCIYGTGGTDYMVVGYITYSVNVEQTIMEVTEK